MRQPEPRRGRGRPGASGQGALGDQGRLSAGLRAEREPVNMSGKSIQAEGTAQADILRSARPGETSVA